MMKKYVVCVVATLLLVNTRQAHCGDWLVDFKQMLQNEASLLPGGKTSASMTLPETTELRNRVLKALAEDNAVLTRHLRKSLEDESQYAAWFAADSGKGANVPEKIRLFEYFALSHSFREFAAPRLSRDIYPACQRFLVELLVYNYLQRGEAYAIPHLLEALATDENSTLTVRVRAATLMGLGSKFLEASFAEPELTKENSCQFDELTSIELSAYHLRGIVLNEDNMKRWMKQESGSILGFLSEARRVVTICSLSINYSCGERFARFLDREFILEDPSNGTWRTMLKGFLDEKNVPHDLLDAEVHLRAILEKPWKNQLLKVKRIQNYMQKLRSDPSRLEMLITAEMARERGLARVFDKKKSILANMLKLYIEDSNFLSWSRDQMKNDAPAELAGFLAESYFCSLVGPPESVDRAKRFLENVLSRDIKDAELCFPARLRLFALATDANQRSQVFRKNGMVPREPELPSLDKGTKVLLALLLARAPEPRIFANLSYGVGYQLSLDFVYWIRCIPDARIADPILKTARDSFVLQNSRSAHISNLLSLPGNREER